MLLESVIPLRDWKQGTGYALLLPNGLTKTKKHCLYKTPKISSEITFLSFHLIVRFQTILRAYTNLPQGFSKFLLR